MNQSAEAAVHESSRRDTENLLPFDRTPSGTSAALAEASDAVHALWAQATEDEVRARYAIGQLLCNVRSARQTYGERAVEHIASRLQLSVHSLYRFANVAESWRPEEFHALRTRKNCDGQPLSWWHWVALTKVAAAVSRRQMTERCLAAGWSVRQLAHAIATRAEAGPLGRNDDIAEGQSVRVALAEGVQNASRAAIHLRVFTDALKSRIEEGSRDEAYLLRALAVHERLRENVEATVAYLREVTASSGRRVPLGVRLRVEAPRRVERTEEEGEREAEGGARRRRAGRRDCGG